VWTVDNLIRVEKKPLLSQSRVAALLSLLVAGLGQCYNRQWGKGLLLALIIYSFLFAWFDFFHWGLWGMITLGEIPVMDHSLKLLAQGLLSAILIAGLLTFYAVQVKDAYDTGKLREQGREVPGIMDTYKAVSDRGFPYFVVIPAIFLMLITILLPILFMVFLSFTNYDLYHQPPAKLVDYVGFRNFANLVELDYWKSSFLSVLSWTLVWTIVATTVQIALGLFLAIVLNQKDLKGKRFFRTVLILPWAVPAYVSVIVFSGLFDNTFGPINQFLGVLGMEPIPWMTDAFWTKIALLFIQFWLGFPFCMALYTGVLQSIPSDLYEAAEVDGATAWQKFRSITLPLALYATAPLLIMQYAFNFNNFNVIYLFHKGLPAVPGQTAGGTDILISWVYKLTFDLSKFNYAAAISVIMGMAVMAFAFVQLRSTRAFKEEGMIQ